MIKYFNEHNSPHYCGRKKDLKLVSYCQVGKSLDLAKFAIESAIQNSGMTFRWDYDICFVCWGTSDEVYNWLDNNKFWHVDIENKKEELGFVEQLYRGWNVGYDIAYKYADYCLPIATDHAFYKNWMINLYKWASSKRIVSCTLIEPGTLPTIHIKHSLGITNHESFNHKGFKSLCEQIYQDAIFVDPYKGQFLEDFGRDINGNARQEAMPFIVHKEIWEKYGPMSPAIDGKITGDTAFFDRLYKSNIDVCVSRGSISYHCGGLETARNK